MDLSLTLTLELNIQISEFILKMVTLYDENIGCIDTLEAPLQGGVFDTHGIPSANLWW